MSTHILQWGDDNYELSADWSQAAGQVYWCGESTPFQVADFRHDWEAAARRLMRDEARCSCIELGDDELKEIVTNSEWIP